MKSYKKYILMFLVLAVCCVGCYSTAFQEAQTTDEVAKAIYHVGQSIVNAILVGALVCGMLS